MAVIGLVLSVAGPVAYWLIAPPDPTGHPSHRRCQWVPAWAGRGRSGPRRRSAARALEEEAAERRRQAEALAAADEERSRIVREVHDIVGHSVTVMLLHAGAAQRLMDTDLPQQQQLSIRWRRSAREALAEPDRALACSAATIGRAPPRSWGGRHR